MRCFLTGIFICPVNRIQNLIIHARHFSKVRKQLFLFCRQTFRSGIVQDPLAFFFGCLPFQSHLTDIRLYLCFFQHLIDMITFRFLCLRFRTFFHNRFLCGILFCHRFCLFFKSNFFLRCCLRFRIQACRPFCFFLFPEPIHTAQSSFEFFFQIKFLCISRCRMPCILLCHIRNHSCRIQIFDFRFCFLRFFRIFHLNHRCCF